MESMKQKQALLNDPRTPYGTRVMLTSRGGGIRAGYMSKYNRNVKKAGKQLRGLPGCGSTIKDWL